VDSDFLTIQQFVDRGHDLALDAEVAEVVEHEKFGVRDDLSRLPRMNDVSESCSVWSTGTFLPAAEQQGGRSHPFLHRLQVEPETCSPCSNKPQKDT
jgi:hypothetical protein